MIQDTNTHQKHLHCSMWKPRIPLHQYLDTEYVSILNIHRYKIVVGAASLLNFQNHLRLKDNPPRLVVCMASF